MSARALSLRQPWAFAVLHLGKRIENRIWRARHRGEFFIHAAKGCTRQEWDEAIAWITSRFPEMLAKELPRFGHVPTGGIVGRASLVDVLPPICAGIEDMGHELERRAEVQHGADPRWHMPEQWGFVLADVTATPFVPCRGMLSFFPVPEGLREQLGAGGPTP